MFGLKYSLIFTIFKFLILLNKNKKNVLKEPYTKGDLNKRPKKI